MMNFWKGKKVLVTGGAGFIGSYLVDELVSYGADVTITISPKTHQKKVQKNLHKVLKYIKVEKVDLLSKNDAVNVCKGKDIVLHIAALDGGKAFKTQNAELVYDVNLKMGLHLLEAARINAVERLLIISSIEVYPPNTTNPVTENQAQLQNSEILSQGYPGAKRYIEREAIKYFKQYQLSVAIARLGNTYGPRDHTIEEKKRVIPTFINQALLNEDITLWGDGSTEVSFIHAADLAPNILKLTEKYAIADPVNLVSTQYISLKELAKHIILITKSNSKIAFVHKSSIWRKNKVFSIDKAVQEIKFKEKITLQKGLKQTIEAFIKEN